MATLHLTADSTSGENTTFSTPYGSVAYVLETSDLSYRDTQISKIERGGAKKPIGRVKLCDTSENEVFVNGRQIKFETRTAQSFPRQKLKVFRASNNYTYKWETSATGTETLMNNEKDQVVAVFERGSKSEARLASLRIGVAESSPVADEIFVTSIYMQHKARKRRQGGAVGGGAVGGC